MTYNQIKIFH